MARRDRLAGNQITAHRLASFFEQLRPLLAQSRARQAVPSCKLPSVPAMQAMFEAISPRLSVARQRGSFLDPWSVVGIRRNEVPNSAILAALWDTARSGEAGRHFLIAFLDRLRSQGQGALPPASSLESNYAVRTEQCPMGEIADRIDIVIEGKEFVLAVEVKIDAAEREGQLLRYQRTIERRARAIRKTGYLVFLSRVAPSIAIPHASWTDVALAARAVTRNSSETGLCVGLMDCFADRCAGFDRG